MRKNYLKKPNIAIFELRQVVCRSSFFPQKHQMFCGPAFQVNETIDVMYSIFHIVSGGHSYLKDLVLVTSLIIATGGCWFAYIQHKYSQSHVKKMMKDLDNLQKAEDSLSELQNK